MRQFARPTLVLYYLLKESKLKLATGRTIFNAQDKAADYYTDLLPKEFHKRKAAIIKENGFTPKSWQEVLVAAGSFYFIPSESMKNANNAIRKLCSQYVLMNGTIHGTNMLYATLENLYERGTLERSAKSDRVPYLYNLPTATIKKLDTYFKELKKKP